MGLEQTRIKDLQYYDPEAIDAPPIEEIVVMVDHPSFLFPKKLGYLFSDLISIPEGTTTEQLLALLGVSQLTGTNTGDQDLSGYVTTSEGYSLISNTELTRLSQLKQNCFSIELPSGNVDERCSGFVETADTTDWVLEPDTSPSDLSITHDLGRKVANVIVKYVDDDIDHLAKDNLGYSSYFCDSNRVVIEDLTPTLEGYPIVIHLIFA